MESRELEAALERVRSFYGAYAAYVGARVVGYPELLERLFTAFLSGGHVLHGGRPGLGKTSLAKAWAAFFGLEFRRVQFTPDLMPLDVIGSNILQDGERGREFRVLPGPHLRQRGPGGRDQPGHAEDPVGLPGGHGGDARSPSLGAAYPLPDPFFVIATQNPIELEGTYPLPEAQVDRFFMKLRFASPTSGP
ncbi:MAG: AAA family ATPase [Candidatus Moduliflexus flocculans]|nr:AAA family ATPase [Candidatus Moduliflexus flocculans]